jgi:hypothetical protein
LPVAAALIVGVWRWNRRVGKQGLDGYDARQSKSVAMRQQHEVRANSRSQRVRSVEGERSLKFASNSAFQVELRRRVDTFFRTTACGARLLADVPEDGDSRQLFRGAYLLLVVVAQTRWHGVLSSVLLGLSAAESGSISSMTAVIRPTRIMPASTS